VGGEHDGGYSEPEAFVENPWPGKRALAAVWVSELGALLFGGQTCTACSDVNNRGKEVLNDMWLSYPEDSFAQWTWIRPIVDQLPERQRTNVAGIAGRGIYTSDPPSSWPGARAGPGVWVASDPDAYTGYMFGGMGYGASNYYTSSTSSSNRNQGAHCD